MMSKIRLFYTVFFLLLFFGCIAYTPTSGSQFAGRSLTQACMVDFGSSVLASSLPIVVLIVIFSLSLAFMVANIAQNSYWEAWVKTELSELVLALVMIGGVLTLFMVSCDFSYALANDDPYEIADNYLREVYNEGYDYLAELSEKSFQNQVAAVSNYWFIGLPIWGGWGWAPNADRKALSSAQEIAINILVTSLASVHVQRVILAVVKSMTLQYLLPIAFILRILPFSRSIGNFFIALSLGLYVLLPLTYVLNSSMIKSTSGGVILLSQIMTDVGNQIHSDSQVVDFARVGIILPQAIFFPNISIVLLITFVSCMSDFFQKITW